MFPAMNYLLYFRCKPARGIKFNTKMAKDVSNALNRSYEKKTFSLKFPEALDFLHDIEKVTSSTLQPLRLFYEHNAVTHSIAVIFVNKAKDAVSIKKGKKARKLFREELNF